MGISNQEFKKILADMQARGLAENDSEGPKKGSGEAQRTGKVIRLPPRQTDSLKLEQNLGCELPVCVSNRRDVNKPSIDIVTDSGQVWSLERTAKSKLPAPEHYPYWLWFLDRLQAAAEEGCTVAPRVELNPPELFELFGAPHGGRRYQQLDEAFERFSLLVIRERSAFFDGGREYETKANLGLLCSYRSWRAKPQKSQEVLDFARGWVCPGPILWASVRAGYLKSVPLTSIRELDYVGQRLLTYLSKHCRSGGEFSVSSEKLLPKIPLDCPPNELKRRLDPHHEALARTSFLADVEVAGRGANKLLTYRRT